MKGGDRRKVLLLCAVKRLGSWVTGPTGGCHLQVFSDVLSSQYLLVSSCWPVKTSALPLLHKSRDPLIYLVEQDKFLVTGNWCVSSASDRSPKANPELIILRKRNPPPQGPLARTCGPVVAGTLKVYSRGLPVSGRPGWSLPLPLQGQASHHVYCVWKILLVS